MNRVTLILVMGVSGCGKTTVGEKLTELLAHEGQCWLLLDADDFHPPANIAKMSAGIPLDDDDRAPWLVALRKRLEAATCANEKIVLACSALKMRYRTALIAGAKNAAIVYLKGSQEVLLRRLDERRGHFMKAAMLESQLATLEEPQASEAARVIVCDIAFPLEQIVSNIRRHL